jgi:hypothetical protein
MDEQIDSLNFNLNKLRGELYALIADHSHEDKQLQAEIENNVNHEYIKNILTSTLAQVINRYTEI